MDMKKKSRRMKARWANRRAHIASTIKTTLKLRSTEAKKTQFFKNESWRRNLRKGKWLLINRKKIRKGIKKNSEEALLNEETKERTIKINGVRKQKDGIWFCIMENDNECWVSRNYMKKNHLLKLCEFYEERVEFFEWRSPANLISHLNHIVNIFNSTTEKLDNDAFFKEVAEGLSKPFN